MSDVPEVEVVVLTRAEGCELLERACQRKLGVGMDEFLTRHDACDYPPEWSHFHVSELEMLIPFVR